jgi:hypothetical protein
MSEPTIVNETELLERAASGDGAALANLAMCCAAREDIIPFEAFAAAEAFARLAAMRGGANERLLLAGVLRVRSAHLASMGVLDRAAGLLQQSELLCDEFPSVPLCDGVEFLVGVLTAHADYQGGESAADRLNKLMTAMSATDAAKLRAAVDSAIKAARETTLA